MYAIRLLISGASLALLAACAQAQSGDRFIERFMQADANGDGLISRAEAPSRLDFDAADANGDDLLTQEEVQAYMVALRG